MLILEDLSAVAGWKSGFLGRGVDSRSWYGPGIFLTDQAGEQGFSVAARFVLAIAFCSSS
jgi:hypothetical protein